MMWEKVKIGDVYEGLYDGPHATPPTSDDGAIFLGISNITKDGHIDLSDIKYINENDLPKWTKRVTPKGGDIVFSYEATLNLYAIIPDDFWGCLGRRMALIRPDETKAHGKYLYYYFFSEEWRSTVSSHIITGATVDRIPIAKFPKFIISLPPMEKQHKIANILSNYDDLIVNNKKQIKLLEEAAQRLYKEWFVDLRFPGYEDVEIVDGVPEGWKEEKLIDIANVQYGFAFDSSLFNSQGKGKQIIRIRNIPSGITDDYTTQGADEQYIVSNGDIVVGMDGEFHINSWCGKTAYLVQRTCKFIPKKELMRGWLLQAIYGPIKYFEKTVVGATVAHLGKKHIDTIELLTGPDELYIPFKTLFDKRQLLLNQNILLSEARDRLLPKLMSGEIEV